MNKNSNSYIITYSIVMVVVVAALLATISLSLKNRQNDNIRNEKRQQIVKALGEDPLTTSYETVIDRAAELDASGQEISGVSEDDIFSALGNMKETLAAKKYPVFYAKNGCIVVPVYGAGLWDAIWGYVALEPDMNTIKGIVLDHKGETPGLGAEISTDKHQAQYVGKTIFNDSAFVGISLVKGGVNTEAPEAIHEVDAITGGTKTSNGVTDMLKTCLQNYVTFFLAHRPAPAVEQNAQTVENEDETNQINIENND